MISAHHSLDGLYVFWLNCASVILGVVVFYVLFLCKSSVLVSYRNSGTQILLISYWYGGRDILTSSLDRVESQFICALSEKTALLEKYMHECFGEGVWLQAPRSYKKPS